MQDLRQTETEPAANQPATNQAAASQGCSCGAAAPGELPELDARLLPAQIRHAAILGALSSLAEGHGLVLVAPHDPVPLLKQVEQRWPGRFDLRYLDRGPQAWRVELLRGAH